MKRRTLIGAALVLLGLAVFLVTLSEDTTDEPTGAKEYIYVDGKKVDKSEHMAAQAAPPSTTVGQTESPAVGLEEFSKNLGGYLPTIIFAGLIIVVIRMFLMVTRL